jgi:hypothetical protein
MAPPLNEPEQGIRLSVSQLKIAVTGDCDVTGFRQLKIESVLQLLKTEAGKC